MTNDGATILKAIGVDNPAAKVLVGAYMPLKLLLHRMYLTVCSIMLVLLPRANHLYLSLASIHTDMSKVQDDEVGDGTTSVTVLAAELLRVRLPSQILHSRFKCFVWCLQPVSSLFVVSSVCH